MWRVFCLELRVAFRHGADIAGPLWFFLMVITLFPHRCIYPLTAIWRCWGRCWRAARR